MPFSSTKVRLPLREKDSIQVGLTYLAHVREMSHWCDSTDHYSHHTSTPHRPSKHISKSYEDLLSIRAPKIHRAKGWIEDEGWVQNMP